MEYGFLVVLLVLGLFYLYFARKEYLRESFSLAAQLTQKKELPKINSPYH